MKILSKVLKQMLQLKLRLLALCAPSANSLCYLFVKDSIPHSGWVVGKSSVFIWTFFEFEWVWTVSAALLSKLVRLLWPPVSYSVSIVPFFPLWCLSPSSMLLDFLKKKVSEQISGWNFWIFSFQRRFLLCFWDWSFNGRPDFHAPWPASSCRRSCFFF